MLLMQCIIKLMMYCNFMSRSMGNKANDIKKCFERSSFPHQTLKDNHKSAALQPFFVKSFPTDSNLLLYEAGLHNNAHIREDFFAVLTCHHSTLHLSASQQMQDKPGSA